MKRYSILLIMTVLAVTSCGKKEPETPVISPDVSPNFTGEEAVKVREQTLVELLAIKKGVKQSITENRTAKTIAPFLRDLESLRPRLEYIHMQRRRLPKSEQMVIRGNLAVATNQLEKDLMEVLAKDPGNDDLAVEIAHLREQLSPIPLGSLLQKY